jgi:hypothetical protein
MAAMERNRQQASSAAGSSSGHSSGAGTGNSGSSSSGNTHIGGVTRSSKPLTVPSSPALRMVSHMQFVVYFHCSSMQDAMLCISAWPYADSTLCSAGLLGYRCARCCLVHSLAPLLHEFCSTLCRLPTHAKTQQRLY